MRIAFLRHNTLFMMLLALVVGCFVGLGAMAFRSLVAFVHNLFILGKFSFFYDENLHTPLSIWGIGIILVPVFGGLIVIWLIEKFAHDERGLSISEIMYKIRYQDGKIQPSVALAKTLASAVSIGSGASIGREGPVVQIGAALSSILGDIFNISVEQRKLLVAMGAAAGTAAIFHAPLAGIAFGMELFLISINAFSVILLSISAFTASLVAQQFIGDSPIFFVPAVYHIQNYFLIAAHLAAFVVIGVVIGILSAFYIHGVYWMEDLFNYYFKNPYFRHTIGMLLIGIMLYMMMSISGHYYIGGVGYSTIQDCLHLIISNPWLLLLLAACKILATCLSLGTGSSGGIFSPALFIGATLGTFFGVAFNYFLPMSGIDTAIFTIIGMACVVGSTTGAIATAIILSFEMTGCFDSILPMTVAVFIAYFTRRQLCYESIYTLKLVRRERKAKHEIKR